MTEWGQETRAQPCFDKKKASAPGYNSGHGREPQPSAGRMSARHNHRPRPSEVSVGPGEPVDHLDDCGRSAGLGGHRNISVGANWRVGGLRHDGSDSGGVTIAPQHYAAIHSSLKRSARITPSQQYLTTQARIAGKTRPPAIMDTRRGARLKAICRPLATIHANRTSLSLAIGKQRRTQWGP